MAASKAEQNADSFPEKHNPQSEGTLNLGMVFWRASYSFWLGDFRVPMLNFRIAVQWLYVNDLFFGDYGSPR
jgi:hypothetical protein